MASDIIIHPYNAVYNTIQCDQGVAADLYDYFSFEAPNSQWIIRKARQKAAQLGRPVKFSGWNGRVNLFSKATNKLYAGLNQRLENFARDRDLTVQYDYKVADDEFSVHEAKEFIKTLNLPHEVRDYQLETFVHAVRKRRGLLLGPTGSGKSLIIYLLVRYYANKPKTLIIVPTLNLLNQMFNDFKDYGYTEPMHLISAGAEKDNEHGVYCSTWQSIYEMPKAYFNQFRQVIVDEVHGADAKSLKGIMEQLTLCPYRFGFTGTLKETQCHRLVLEGLFGPVFQPVSTQELIETKYLSDLIIKCIVLQYDTDVCRQNRKLKYDKEIDFLTTHTKRNRFLRNLALSLEGPVLLLFRKIDHGNWLYQIIGEKSKRPVYLIYGATPAEEREQIRQIMDKEENPILVGSYGCVSTGINIPRLRHVIFGSPYKSRVKVLQSIGRGLRKTADKEELIVYDIADDMTHRLHQNFTLKHYVARVKIYAEERFKYKTYRVQIRENNNNNGDNNH